jgi:hypothetical protein
MFATSLMITDREMQAATNQGRASQLCGDIPEIRRFRGTWWLGAPEGWLRITDCYLSERFDQIRQRLDIAEEDIAVEAAHAATLARR